MSFHGTSMKLTHASSYNNVYGILLERVDSDIERGACGTIARAKSFKATELVMAPEPTCEDGADQARRKRCPQKIQSRFSQSFAINENDLTSDL